MSAWSPAVASPATYEAKLTRPHRGLRLQRARAVATSARPTPSTWSTAASAQTAAGATSRPATGSSTPSPEHFPTRRDRSGILSRPARLGPPPRAGVATSRPAAICTKCAGGSCADVRWDSVRPPVAKRCRLLPYHTQGGRAVDRRPGLLRQPPSVAMTSTSTSAKSATSRITTMVRRHRYTTPG